MAFRVETTWSTKSARKVLVDVGFNVTSEVCQKDASVTEVLCARRLLLLLLLLLLLVMMTMMMTVLLIVVSVVSTPSC